MTALVDALARHLAAKGVGVYTPDAVIPDGVTPISVGGFTTSHDTAVAVTTYPGPPPDSRNGWEYPRLQVRVRAIDPLAALDLDRAAYDALEAHAGTLPGGQWVASDCYALQSEPAPLGVDANGRHEYARNYQLATSAAG